MVDAAKINATAVFADVVQNNLQNMNTAGIDRVDLVHADQQMRDFLMMSHATLKIIQYKGRRAEKNRTFDLDDIQLSACGCPLGITSQFANF